MNTITKKVLIADDEVGTRESLRYILDALNYSIDQAEDGAKAKILMKNNKYDFVFLDINMPGLSGVELIKLIRETWPDTIIIVVTGYSCMEEFFALSIGAHEYIEKPFSINTVKEICLKHNTL
jgi:DNA-binding response OmpR family regulator